METVCNLCPRRCGAVRSDSVSGGFCHSPLLPQIARAAPHFGEEPCIAGSRGTGAIFFTGCNLRCVFCQNMDISRGRGGSPVSIEKLKEIILSLEDSGVDSIDLVTGAHYIPAIASALSSLKLSIPVVWNSSGYEGVDALRMLDGLVQVYMPDYKYFRSEPAKKYSSAKDYSEVASAAIKEMFRQVGAYELDANGLMKKGVLIRHLIMPGLENDAMDVIDFAADEFPRGSVLFSLMSQYTPLDGLDDFPELRLRIDRETNEHLIHYMQVRHLDGFWQDTASSTDELIPDFDGTGVR